MLQNNLQYTLAKITHFSINNEKRIKQRKTRKKTHQKFRLKYALDSNGSIFGIDVNAIYLPKNVMLIKTTVKDLRDVQ